MKRVAPPNSTTLCESFDYLRQQPKLTADNLKALEERTFYGKEKKPLAYVIAIMNRILRHRSAERHPHQHADREPGRHSGQGSD